MYAYCVCLFLLFFRVVTAWGNPEPCVSKGIFRSGRFEEVSTARLAKRIFQSGRFEEVSTARPFKVIFQSGRFEDGLKAIFQRAGAWKRFSIIARPSKGNFSKASALKRFTI